MAVAIKPLEDRIVVKANEAETTTASGLVIPDTAKEKPQEGTVVAVGPGRFDDGARVPMDVKVGDGCRSLQQIRRNRSEVQQRGLPRPICSRHSRDNREVVHGQNVGIRRACSSRNGTWS